MISEADFTFVAREVKVRSGAILGPETSILAENRLTPLSRREGYNSVGEMIQAAKIQTDGKLWAAVADALLQSETRFFRDRDVFAALGDKVLPDLWAGRGRPLRIWSAGCSTGQEAYSLAMLIEDLRAEGLPGADIVATDISERLLDKARSGLYTQFEVQRGLPIRKLIAHFEKAGDLWRISDRMRASVRFEQHNLLQSATQFGPFDLIACRNVLTSFDGPTRLEAVSLIAAALAPDGVLILGQNESLPDGARGFVRTAAGYAKATSAVQAA